MISSGPRRGYLIAPPAATAAPGVLVLHSWWGLTGFFKRFCDRLATEGYVALAPDLHLGRTPTGEAEASELLASMDPNIVADLVVSSAATLRGIDLTADRPVGVVGFSMGASWGLWLASRQPHLVAAVSAFYGSQTVGFERAEAAFQVHAAEHDPLVSDDDLVLLEAALRLDGHDVDLHRYPGTGHWFMEDDRPDAFRPDASALAWERTLAFLDQHLRGPR